MNYIFDFKSLEKKNITINDIIDYFAEYINLNNLGIIGDAHLALADQDNLGAKGKIPMKLAELFSQAVDAPKTGLKIELNQEERAKKYPHYMGKKKNKSYISNNILKKYLRDIDSMHFIMPFVFPNRCDNETFFSLPVISP